MEYYQLTARERYLILHHKSNGCSLRQIGELLQRSASTISRELRRNVSGDGRYRPDKADSYARARRRRCRRGSRFGAEDIELVRSLVQRKWSPEQVSRRLRKLRRLDIGTATIYRMLVEERAQGGRSWLQLRQLSQRYRKGYRVVDRRGRMQGKRPLGDRPAGAQDRTEAGTWRATPSWAATAGTAC